MNSELIERLEKATGGDRQLDALIEVELRRWQAYDAGLNDKQRAHWKPVGVAGEVEEGGTRHHSPTYSFSIDAALTLVPEGKEWNFHRVHDPLDGNKPYFYASIDESQVHYGATPALALCIAALKARAACCGVGRMG